jgi:cell division protein FtsZ
MKVQQSLGLENQLNQCSENFSIRKKGYVMFEVSENETSQSGAKIKVIGVGGGGCNAVNTMIKAGLSGVEYIVANTDRQALENSMAPTKIQLGSELTKGLGAGANPGVGRQAALDEYENISEHIKGADMVFVTAGMGGGTGTGAAPVIATLARELGALTVGVVTKPFLFEGRKRTRQAKEGIQTLEENVDSLITIPNQKLLDIAGQNLSLVDTFKRADEVLLNAVRGISDLINNNGYINADFADVSTVMKNKGLALMGTGTHNGEDRAVRAATEAISSPLLDDITIDGATGIIINITGDSSLSMHETNQAVTLIMEAADEDAEIIFGTVIDDNLGEDIKVTVVATGLGGQDRVSVASAPRSKVIAEPVAEAAVQELLTQEIVEEAAPEIKMEESVIEEIIEAPIHIIEEDIIEENPQINEMIEETPIVAQAEENNRPSALVQSIREAANRYEASKSVGENENTFAKTASNPAPTENRELGNTRAKSIAERLGFMNFDEDELDRPSFMRKGSESEPRLQ